MGSVEQSLGDCGIDLVVQPERRREVTLRIKVDQKDALAQCGERGADVRGGRRLADAALLVGNGYDRRHLRTRSRFPVAPAERIGAEFGRS
jgi:hypothetical protein